MHQYIRAHHNHHDSGPQRNMVLISFLVLFLIAIVGFVLGRMYTQGNMAAEYYAEPTPTPDRGAATVTMAPGEQACTMEAMICPDGSAVGRTGPNCSFAPCPSVSQSPKSTIDTSTWKTYTNSTADFQFKYPSNYMTDEEVKNSSTSKVLITLNSGTKASLHYEITVSKFDLNGAKTLDSWVSANSGPNSNLGVVGSTTKEMVNGIEGVEFDATKKNLTRNVAVANGKNVLLFTFEADPNASGTYKDAQAELIDFEGILSTLEFTN